MARRLKVPNTFPYGRGRVGRTKITTGNFNAIRGRVRRPPSS